MSVTPLNVVADPVNESALNLVEETLARIKSGEVISVAIVEVRKSRMVATCVSKGAAYHEMNSGAARLAAQLANDPGIDE